MSSSVFSSNEDAAVSVVNQVLDDLSMDTIGEARLICEVLEREIVELRGDPHLLELLRASVESNVATFLEVVRTGAPDPTLRAPVSALEYARHLARTTAPVTALVRAYRLGYTTFIDRVYERLAAREIDPVVRLPVFHRIGQIGSEYIDWISENVVRAYQDERERWLSHRDAFRASRIREILTAPDGIDPTTASAALNYRLDRTHRAVIAWIDDTSVDTSVDASRLDGEVRAYAMYAGAMSAPLIVAVDERTVWAWFPVDLDVGGSRADNNPARAGAPGPRGIRLAVGAPQMGLPGFKLSHREAVDAHRVATLGANTGEAVVDYTMPGVAVVAQLTRDVDHIGSWAATVLGDLAQSTDSAGRLRITLREFLQRNGSHKATAAELHLHPNTVKYRVAAAERALGRPLATHRLDIEVALAIARWQTR